MLVEQKHAAARAGEAASDVGRVAGKLEPVYLDGFASAALSPAAQAAMLEAWKTPGNADSPHVFGEIAAAAVRRAAMQVGDTIGASPDEIIFTSGATEANSMAIYGAARAHLDEGGVRRRIVVSAVEHASVLESSFATSEIGFKTVQAPVGSDGRVDIERLRELVDDRCLLVSIMAVNNETGIVQPVREGARIAHAVGALAHCDAAQAVGKTDIDVLDLGTDLMSISAHKAGGPMGVGALFVAEGATLPRAVLYGGGQQRGRRPGTLASPLIAGFGAALAAGRENLEARMAGRELALRSLLESIERGGITFEAVGGYTTRISGGISIRIRGVSAVELRELVTKSVIIASTAACSSNSREPSHVMLAMGLNQQESNEVLRILVADHLNIDDAKRAGEAIAVAAIALR